MSTDNSAPSLVIKAAKFGKVLDQSLCIGCHACTTACKSENEVPLSVSRTYVKSVDVGIFPQARREFQVTRCNQCDDAPCVSACPTSAMFQRSDGIVDFDKDSCIGCKACMAACPYDAIFINPDDHSAEKCNFCAHRLEAGLEPACVVVCPVEAIFVGNINDPTSKVSKTLGRHPTTVRRPEKETRPKVFYKAASQHTLDPLAAERPAGGIFAWAQQGPEDSHHINSGVPRSPGNTSQAAALLSYDVPHNVPWDWRVGLYTWTKSISAGIYLVAAALVLFGVVDGDSSLWLWATPLVALAFLSVTGAILIWDLEHPSRFYYIFTRGQWRSWLVRGGLIIAGYGLILVGHLLMSVVALPRSTEVMAVAGIPLALMTAAYTAFLFAQASARDLWQSALLVPHFVVQAVVAGTAIVGIAEPVTSHGANHEVGATMAAAACVHLLMSIGEVVLPHGTAHAHLAVYNLTHGRLGRFYWTGAALVTFAAFAPWTGMAIAAPAALAGLLAHEHAYVQAGQSVPLA